MSLDRALADAQAPGDLLVARAAPDQERDLALPGSQEPQAAVGLQFGLGGPARVRRILFEKQRNEFPLGPDLSVMDAVHDLPKQMRVDVSVAVSPRSGLQDADPFPLVGHTGERHDLRVARQRADDRAVADAAHSEQIEVEEKDVRGERGDRALEAVSRRHVADGIGAVQDFPPTAAQIGIGGRDQDSGRLGMVSLAGAALRSREAPAESRDPRRTRDTAHPLEPPMIVCEGNVAGLLRRDNENEAPNKLPPGRYPPISMSCGIVSPN